MKKSLLIVLLVLAAMTPVFSQEMSFGVKAHLSDYSYRGDDWDIFEAMGVENEFSLSSGAFAFLELRLHKNFAIQPELGFTFAKHQYGNGSNWMTENYKVIEFPVYAKFLLPTASGSFYAMAGPKVMMLLGDVELEDDAGNTASSTVDNNIIFGVSIAAGYEFNLGNGSIIAGARYSTIFSEVVDDVKIFTNGIGLEVGYKF